MSENKTIKNEQTAEKTQTQKIIMALADATRLIDDLGLTVDIDKITPASATFNTVKQVADFKKISLEDACALLGVTDADKTAILATAEYQRMQGELTEIKGAFRNLVVSAAKIGITTKASARQSSKSAGGQTGRFYAECPICKKEIHGSLRSLVTNSIRLHMEKEHEVSKEDFNKLYRGSVNASIVDTLPTAGAESVKTEDKNAGGNSQQ